MFFSRTISYKLRPIHDKDSLIRYRTIKPSLVIDFIFNYCIKYDIEVINFKEDSWENYKFTFRKCKRSTLTRLVYELNKEYGDYIEEIRY